MFDSVSHTGERLNRQPLQFLREAIRLRKRWHQLSRDFLPITTEDSLWRFSRAYISTDPHQGWKIHLSATILSATDVLAAAAPILRSRGVLFKAAASLDELAKLNSGLHYGYAQIGKFITIYPTDDQQFREIIEQLAKSMPAGISAPAIPFDIRHPNAPNIFYRYGGFTKRPFVNDKGNTVSGINDPDGEPVEDRRDIPAPDWVSPPIETTSGSHEPSPTSPHNNRYRIFRSISQRGKGGVYEAIDTQSSPPRLCIVKEGRRHGETAWDGRDGNDRVKNEAVILRKLSRTVPGVPRIYDLFEVDDYFYLISEKIEGESLQKYLSGERSVTNRGAEDLKEQLTEILHQIHKAGYVWRDCKPGNLIVTPDGILRPIDFEGSTPINRPDPLPWNTPNFSPPKLNEPTYMANLTSNLPEDEFALDACLAYIDQASASCN